MNINCSILKSGSVSPRASSARTPSVKRDVAVVETVKIDADLSNACQGDVLASRFKYGRVKRVVKSPERMHGVDPLISQRP